MSKLAVVKTGGKQYLVKEGSMLKVEKLATEGKQVELTEVLLVGDSEGKQVEVGQPRVKAKVVSDLVTQGRAKKILVVHYKAKVRYHKKYGHRQPYSELKVTSIS